MSAIIPKTTTVRVQKLKRPKTVEDWKLAIRRTTITLRQHHPDWTEGQIATEAIRKHKHERPFD